MKHLGNVTEINGSKIEPVDIITFGSPCQDMSVAGKREGLKHEDEGHDETTRSGLFYEAIRIIKEMRKATNGEYPKYAVWENVPGAFSSNKEVGLPCRPQAFCSVCDDEVSVPGPCDAKEQISWFGTKPETSWEVITLSHGECLMLNTGEYPNAERESTLSQILQVNVPEKYYLSPTACEGICRRAMKRGKVLPLMLWEALMEVLEMGGN